MFSRESLWSVNICPDSGLVTGKDVAGGGIGGRGHTWDLPPQIFSEVKSQDLPVRNLKNILLYFISLTSILSCMTPTQKTEHTNFTNCTLKYLLNQTISKLHNPT